MSQGKKILLGVLTIWPITYMVAFVVAAACLVVLAPPPATGGPPVWFLVLFVFHALTMLVILGLLIIYVRHVFRTDHIAADKKALWAVVLFLGNVIAMPVYWYLYIWKEPLPGDAHGPRR
jgi:hypothetical protein